MKNGRIAIPSNGQGGLDATRSDHFGHCSVFTLVDIQNSEIKKVSILQNQGHIQGGCMAPVSLLSENKVNALIVKGIGMRPLMGFKQMGIRVYHDDQHAKISLAAADLIVGNLPEIRNNQVCSGDSCHT